jgi:signal transduction histidine kinase
MRFEPTPRRWAAERVYVLVFVLLGASLLVAAMIVQRVSSGVQTLSDELVDTTLPRIERIASLRTSTLEVELAVADVIASNGAEHTDAQRRVDILVKRLELDRTSLRASMRETDHDARALDTAVTRFEDAVRRTRTAAATDAVAARNLFRTDVVPAATTLGELALREIEHDAQHGREAARGLEQTRERSIAIAYGLTAGCILLAVFGVLLVRRDTRQRLATLHAQARAEAERADELERFAGRVAHDIRGSLSAAVLATELLQQQSTDEARPLVSRIDKSLSRTTTIIDGLLDFARAGAKPDPGARTELRKAIDDVVDGLRPELDKAHIALELGAVPPVMVACSIGAYLSIVGNLVRNAMKYMGEPQDARIRIRVMAQGSMVRTEVSDTGRGIPPELQPAIFEPYFRAARRAESGLGLGLATVRKLVEGHGGKVGVISAPGQGSTFWFDLPYAGHAADSPQPLGVPQLTDAHS